MAATTTASGGAAVDSAEGTPAAAGAGDRTAVGAGEIREAAAAEGEGATATAAHEGEEATALRDEGVAETAVKGRCDAVTDSTSNHREQLRDSESGATPQSAAAKKAARAAGGRPLRSVYAAPSETQDVEDVGGGGDAAAADGLLRQLQLLCNSSREEAQQQEASDTGAVHSSGTSTSAIAVRDCSYVERRHVAPAAAGEEIDEVIFIADGRFHLEACMIQNPSLKFFRYDPFVKRLFRESYDIERLHRCRRAAIQVARSARCAALLLSTLGRQGSVGVLEDLQQLLEARRLPYCIVLFSELSPLKLKRLAKHVDCFIQVACPRLSIDWGTGYATGGRPLLTPYEAHVAFGQQPYLDDEEQQVEDFCGRTLRKGKPFLLHQAVCKSIYPMDYYSKDGGVWTNYNTSSGHRSGSLAPTISVQDRKAQLRARLLSRQQRRVHRQHKS